MICTCLMVLNVALLYWMYVTSCSYGNKNGCYSSNITMNSIDIAATERPAPYNISIFLESFQQIDDLVDLRHNFSIFEESIPSTCHLPNGGKCTLQHSDVNVDVVFRVVRKVSTSNPVRYWPGQIVAVLNMEADRSDYGIYPDGFKQLKEADIRIN